MSLTAAHPDRLGSIAPSAYWLYADDDVACYARVNRQLGAERRLLEPAAFQSEIARLTGPFLRWVDAALEESPPDYWIVASFFKDIFCTPVYLHFVCLCVAAHAARQGRSVVVVTRNSALANQLAQGGHALFSTRDTMLLWLKAWLRYLGRPLLLYSRVLSARWILGAKYTERSRDARVLVDTFLFADDIAPDGRYRDRFFPGLLEWYASCGIKAAAMPFTVNVPLRELPAVYRRLRTSQTPFAPGECFLKAFDFLAGMRRALHAFFRPPSFAVGLFEGAAVAALATHWWRLSALETVTYQVWKNVPRRMANRGLRPEQVVAWYENQPLDKAITLGFLEASKSTEVIAGRQYFPSANMVNFFSTNGEVRAGVAPRLNQACGVRIAELFAAHDTGGRYEVVPALRYAHLFDGRDDTAEGSALVVFLTSAREETFGILECIFGANPARDLAFETIIIKMHQGLQSGLQEEIEQRWPETREPRVKWDHRNTRTLLGEARLAVTAGSSVALEAVCYGVPVVVVGRACGILLNPLDGIDARLWRVAFGPRDFEYAVKQWLPSVPDLAARRATGNSIRDRHFARVTPGAMAAFNPRHAENSGIMENTGKS